MKTKPLSLLAATVWLAIFSGLMPVPRADAQVTCECCPLGLPAAPFNLIDFSLTWTFPPAASASFLTATVLANGAVAPGVYASWCADAQTTLLPGLQGYEYLGSVYASTDTNLNPFLAVDTTNANALVSPQVWQEVNYLLNHRTGYNYWDVQGAIWHFVGGPAVATPPYPYFNDAAVNQLVSDTLSNAPTWCPQPGGKVAVVVALTWPEDNQIIIMEMPCPGTTPGLAVAVSCPTDCGLSVFSGTVTNTGNVTLANVFVLSSQPSDGTVVLGPVSLAPGAAAVFAGSYNIPCITNLTTNTVGIVTTNVVFAIQTNTVAVVTTNTAGVVTTNLVPVIVTNTAAVITTNTAGIVTTNVVPVIVTNTMAVVTTNQVPVVLTNTVAVITTNLVPVITTNVVSVITTNTTGVVTTNIVPVILTNVVAVVTTNTTFVITTNVVPIVTTNTVFNITTNTTVIVTTNSTGVVPATAGAATFGTIAPAGSVGTVTDRFAVGTNFHGLTYSDSDHGYAATKFYSLRHDSGANADFFDTIAPTGATGTITDRFTLPQYNFDALAYAAPDVGYGPTIFYYLRHDANGISSFGSITPGGVVGVTADHKVVGSNFDALTFSATDVGFGANLFYYVRHDTNCNYIFGTIDPAQGGPVTDRFGIGANVDALVFTATDVGYGVNNFYYLRHDNVGNSTFGTILVTGLTTGNVTDRFSVGTNVTELSFTTTDVLYGPNLFYYLRGTPKSGCALITFATNTVTSFTTNAVTTFTTNNVSSFTTNSVVNFATNNVISFVTNSVTTFATNTVTTFATNAVTSFSTNSVINLTTNNVISFVTNNVTIFATNSVTTFATNTVTSFTTNSVINLSTNNVISFVTNSVTTFVTNTLTSFTTNVLSSFVTNSVINLITNNVASYTTNIMAGAITNTVTTSGTDICQARTVTATATCAGAGSQHGPLFIGGGGAPAPYLNGGNLYLSFPTESGVSYVVQYKASLAASVWTDLQTVVGTGGIMAIAEAVAGQPAGFYRLKLTP